MQQSIVGSSTRTRAPLAFLEMIPGVDAIGHASPEHHAWEPVAIHLKQMDHSTFIELVVTCFLFCHDRDNLLPSLQRTSAGGSSVEQSDAWVDDAVG